MTTTTTNGCCTTPSPADNDGTVAASGGGCCSGSSVNENNDNASSTSTNPSPSFVKKTNEALGASANASSCCSKKITTPAATKKPCCDDAAGSKSCAKTKKNGVCGNKNEDVNTQNTKKSCCNDKGNCSKSSNEKSCVSNNKADKEDCCTSPPKSGMAVNKSSCCDEKGGGCSSSTSTKPNPSNNITALNKSCCDKNEGSSCAAMTEGQTSCCDEQAMDKSCSSKKTPTNVKTKSCCDDEDTGCCVAKPEKQTCISNDRGECCDTATTIKCTSSETQTCCDTDGTDTQINTGNTCSSQGCCVMTHTCLAVVRPDNSAVDLFDTKGRSRTFRIRNNRRDLSDKKLCFSTHGAGEDIDGMLTPCLDRNGEHDEPDEGCACGEDEPHLHAHIYDPDICGLDDRASCLKPAGGISDAARKKATSWRFLSQLTFYPDDSEAEQSFMPITESMPKECNSSALQSHLNERGLKLSHWLRWRNEGRGNQVCNDESYCGNSCKSHRLYPVQHEDHTDYLIHNETTGELHMEHPNCLSCGENDIHGRFRLVHTRSWGVDDSKGKRKGSRINLHFFQVYDEPFSLLGVLSGMFELESNRTHLVRRGQSVIEETPSASRVGRSQFFVKEICCASEIPQVEGILSPVEGVIEISINPTTRTVYVDHDVDITSANDIANALNDQGFGAVIKKDAAVAIDQMAGIPTDVFVESMFDLTNVLAETNEDDRAKVPHVIKTCLEEKFSDGQVRDISVNEKEKTLSVQHNPYYLTTSGIASALASLMYDVTIVSDGGADGQWALSKEEVEETIEHESSSVRWSVVLSGVLWLISMFSLIGGNFEYLKYVALLSVAFGLPPIAIKAFKTLRRCHFDVNCMMFFAAVGALALQEYTESAAVTFLFAISEALETRATARARNALSAIVCLRPERANVINPITKDIVVLPASAVAVGTSVSVRTGDKIPCDGVVVEGKSTVDESSLTGESRPVNKSVGMPVSGGSINTGNVQLIIKTTATSSNSAVARLIRLIEEAQSNRSDTEKLVDSFAKIYTPIVVLAALCMVTIPWFWGPEVGQFWAKNGLVTIVVACPCALIISTPVTYVAGLAAVAQRGIVVKGGQHLESLGRVKRIAFDKTGTLSQGTFELLHFNVVGKSNSREEVLQYLALMEAPASHPLSEAICKGAANEGIDLPKLQIQNHTLLPGEGISANVDGRSVYVGNKRLFQRLNLYTNLPEEARATEEEWANSGGTTGFISIEGDGIVGTYCVADKIRDEATDVVQALLKMGIECTMLTGDQRPAAIGIGGQIGLKEHEIKSELFPEDKLTEIGDMVKCNNVDKKCWNTKKAVMMVGDGVNDAPALALADVSVAMGEGAALAMDTADVTLMDSNLNKLLYSICMGRRVIRTIIENVAFSLIVKAIVIGFTFAGRASLWAAIAVDVGAMLIVTLNGMKLLPSSRKVKENDLAKVGAQEP